MLKRFNMVIGNVHERFDRVKRHGNENDERRNEVDRRGNFNRRPEQHVNHNLDDFDDKNDDVRGDDFEDEAI
jgi:hypothetical protein